MVSIMIYISMRSIHTRAGSNVFLGSNKALSLSSEDGHGGSEREDSLGEHLDNGCLSDGDELVGW